MQNFKEQSQYQDVIVFYQMSAHLAGRLNYAKGERDMILMRHEVTVNLKDVCNKIRGAPTVHLNVVDTR